MKKDAYVRLLDERVEVRRPCCVYMIDSTLGILLSDNYYFEDPDEIWEVYLGNFVRCFQDEEGILNVHGVA